MSLFRSKADRIIDAAHNAIACAEMAIEHSFTDVDKAAGLKQLAAAQNWLRRACDAKRAWNAVEHDDFEEYPDIGPER